MQVKEVTVLKKEGVMNQDAARLVQKAMKFQSDIFIGQPYRKINAKSIMGVLSIGLKKGDKVTLSAKGADEVQAIEEITKALEGKI